MSARRRLPTRTWIVSVMVLALPGAASAQEVSPAEHEAAVTNFQAGRRFVEQGNCKEASSRFIESLRHEQSVGARFNLAECSRTDNRNADAWNQFKGAEQIAAQKKDAERQAAAQKAISELDATVAKIRVVLPQDVAELVVKIDGRPVADVDYTLLATSYAIEAGAPHRIDVTARNRTPWSKLNVKGPPGGEIPVITADLGGPLEPEGANVGAQQRLVGLVVGGVGIAGLAVGSVFGLLASGAKSDAKNACEVGAGTSYPGRCATDSTGVGNAVVDSKNSTAKSDATVSTVAFIAGGVLVAGGAVLYFTAPKAGAPTTGRLHLAPVLGPGTAGAFVAGTF